MNETKEEKALKEGTENIVQVRSIMNAMEDTECREEKMTTPSVKQVRNGNYKL